MDSWYKKWFDTPYYHILYKNRNFDEAGGFLDSIIKFLNVEPDAKILDLACGKGRHAIYLNKKGFDVTGIDLSEKNINNLNHRKSDTLRFHRKDMRESVQKDHFDLILNLFTSFGYFESDDDNQSVIDNIDYNLKPGGIAVIDFMNSNGVISMLPVREMKVIDDIEFDIYKYLENGMVKKRITFHDLGSNYEYEEEVKAYGLNDFANFINNSGMEIRNVFGDYKLNPYDENKSDRLIIVCEKLML